MAEAESRVSQQSLQKRVEQAIAEQAGAHVTAETSGEAIILSGRVDTAEARAAATDIAAALAAGRRIDNDLEVEQLLPEDAFRFQAGAEPTADTPESVEAIREREGELDPDFTDQPLSTSSLESAGVDLSEEADTVYFAPTDPVITTDERGDALVLGGFTPTSTTSVEVAPSASDDELGDEAIADNVRRELREDATTTDLRITVEVREGVVYLRGRVAGIEDAQNAEAVAARAPGVQEVVEELRIEQL